MTTLISQFEINGIVDTNNNILDNMNTIAAASGCYVTFDPSEGKWSVVINEAGSSVRSFNDSTILGSINVSGSGIDELFNSCEVIFPHADLLNDEDSVKVEIGAVERFPNELDNTLTIRQPLINNPVQAAYIANRELKQSRQDKVIQFRSDYSALELKAGDIIDVTSSVYNYTSKLFRIITLVETDTDDGGIECEITAIEYDDAVYDSSGFNREERSKSTGIRASEACPEIADADNAGTAQEVVDAITSDAGLENLGSNGANLLILSEVYGGFNDDEGPIIVPHRSSNSDLYSFPKNPAFIAPFDGKFNMTVNFDQNSSGAQGRHPLLIAGYITYNTRWEFINWSNNQEYIQLETVAQFYGWGDYKVQTSNPVNGDPTYDSLGDYSDYVAVQAFVVELDSTGTPTGEIFGEGSGNFGAFFWTDYVVPVQITCKKDHLYIIYLRMLTYTPANPTTSNWTVGVEVTSGEPVPQRSFRDLNNPNP